MSTRDALVDAAGVLLDQDGPAAVTLRAVAAACGVSHNAPYKHFISKEALLAEVAARELDRLAASFEMRGPDEAGLAILRRTMIHYIVWATDRPHRFRLVFGVWGPEGENLAASAGEARERMVGLIARSQAEGVLPSGSSPDRLASLLLATAHGAVDLALGGHLARDGKGGAGPDDIAGDLLDLLSGQAALDLRPSRA